MTAKKKKPRLYRVALAILALIFIISAAWAAYYVYDDYRSRSTLSGLAVEMNLARLEMSSADNSAQDLEPFYAEEAAEPGAEHSEQGITSLSGGNVFESNDEDSAQGADRPNTKETAAAAEADGLQGTEWPEKVTNASDSPAPQEQPDSSYTPHSASGTPALPLPSPAPQPDALSLYYASLKSLNPDFGGWIHIDNTIVDYPVMYTPDQLEKYLHRNFEGQYSLAGLPFLDIAYPPDSTGVNQIIYAHNMKSGQMFAVLNEYLKDEFWQEYRTLSFHTPESRRDYEVLALIPLVLGKMDEPRMMIFHPLTTDNEHSVAEINDYLAAYARRFDGQVLQGDDLLTLVTCRRARDSDRLILVARRVNALP